MTETKYGGTVMNVKRKRVPGIVLCIVAYRISVAGVESCTIVFLGRHFLFTSVDIFCVVCII